MTIWIVAVAGLIGFFAGLSAQGHWQEWLLFSNSTPFGQTDRSSTSTSGFYVFEYPFWRYLLGVGFTAVVFSLLGALGPALPVRRGAAAGRRRADDHRGACPPDRAGRRVRAAQGRRLLPGPAGAAARQVPAPTDLYGAGVHRRQRAAAGEGDPGLDLDRGGDRDPGVLQRVHAQPRVARAGARPAGAVRGRGRRHLPGRGAVVHGEAEPAAARKRNTSSGASTPRDWPTG